MAQLEPIVVNAPKEKTVQTFNDKDIERIVTNGIVNGNIPLPEVETGTKLYKHSVRVGTNEIAQFISIDKTNIASIQYMSLYSILSSIGGDDGRISAGPTTFEYILNVQIAASFGNYPNMYSLRRGSSLQFNKDKFITTQQGKCYQLQNDEIDLTTGKMKARDVTGLTPIDLSGFTFTDTITEL